MTNPTPPLTAESFTAEITAYFDQYYNYWIEEEYNIAPLINMVEAYVAQQNAELVAENEMLQKAQQSHNRIIETQRKGIKRLAKGVGVKERKDLMNAIARWETKFNNGQKGYLELKAENERLKQPIETAPKDGTPVEIYIPMIKLTGTTHDKIFAAVDEIKKYNAIQYGSSGASGPVYLDDELYLPNLVRAVIELWEGGSVTVTYPRREEET